MKTIIFLIVILHSFNLSAQDKNVTKGLPNGYAWISPLSVHPPVYAKEESLLACLQQRNVLSEIDSSINKRSFPLGCDNDINELLHKNASIEIKDIVKMIDNFYSIRENLVIPVLGAYCYSVKELAGVDIKELENYRQDLLKYSLSKSE